MLTSVSSPGTPDEPDEPDLSDEAKHVLIEASKDEGGSVSMTKDMHGFNLIAHGMQLVDGKNPRARPRTERLSMTWSAAVCLSHADRGVSCSRLPSAAGVWPTS